MRPHDGEQLTRETVERIARIIGPNSAAAQALRDADSAKDPAAVVFLRIGSSILAMKPMEEA